MTLLISFPVYYRTRTCSQTKKLAPSLIFHFGMAVAASVQCAEVFFSPSPTNKVAASTLSGVLRGVHPLRLNNLTNRGTRWTKLVMYFFKCHLHYKKLFQDLHRIRGFWNDHILFLIKTQVSLLKWSAVMQQEQRGSQCIHSLKQLSFWQMQPVGVWLGRNSQRERQDHVLKGEAFFLHVLFNGQS